MLQKNKLYRQHLRLLMKGNLMTKIKIINITMTLMT